jgi:hypothetical protein
MWRNPKIWKTITAVAVSGMALFQSPLHADGESARKLDPKLVDNLNKKQYLTSLKSVKDFLNTGTINILVLVRTFSIFAENYC